MPIIGGMDLEPRPHPRRRGTCAACEWWLRVAPRSNDGECRADPPRATSFIAPRVEPKIGPKGEIFQAQSVGIGRDTAWPLVPSDAWCGKWSGAVADPAADDGK